MCPKSVWSGLVSSGKYSSLRAVWWERIQATGVWSQWSAVLTFPVSGSGVWNSASSNILNSSSSQVLWDSSLAVIFLASSAECGSNLDASVPFVKASRVAVSFSSPTGSSVSGFLALPLVVFPSSGREILSWKTVFPFQCSFVLFFDWPVAWSTQWLFLLHLHQNSSLWSWFQWVCPFQRAVWPIGHKLCPSQSFVDSCQCAVCFVPLPWVNVIGFLAVWYWSVSSAVQQHQCPGLWAARPQSSSQHTVYSYTHPVHVHMYSWTQCRMLQLTVWDTTVCHVSSRLSFPLVVSSVSYSLCQEQSSNLAVVFWQQRPSRKEHHKHSSSQTVTHQQHHLSMFSGLPVTLLSVGGSLPTGSSG